MRCGCWLLVVPVVMVVVDGLRLSEKVDSSSGEKPTLLCFAWSTQREVDISVLPEVKKQLSQCDGHMFFTDEDAPRTDDTITRVNVPKQTNWARGEETWLLAHNMAGLIPSWSHLLENNIATNYDWVMNSELDHFTRPSQVRNWLVATQDFLTTAKEFGDNPKAEPLMLFWSNAYLFNRAMVSQMREQWQVLGKTIDVDIEKETDHQLLSANGCPDWMEGRPFWPGCAQDIAYKIMATAIMDPPVQVFSAHAPSQETCQVACVAMNVFTVPGRDDSGWDQEEWQLEAIRHFHSGLSNASKFVVLRTDLHSEEGMHSRRYERIEDSLRVLKAHENFDETSATSAFRLRVSKIKSVLHDMLEQESSKSFPDVCPKGPSKFIPLLHEVKHASVHKLARQLLGL